MESDLIKRLGSTKETCPYHIYKSELMNYCSKLKGYSLDLFEGQACRINRAYNNGEPQWMIAMELKIVFENSKKLRGE